MRRPSARLWCSVNAGIFTVFAGLCFALARLHGVFWLLADESLAGACLVLAEWDRIRPEKMD